MKSSIVVEIVFVGKVKVTLKFLKEMLKHDLYLDETEFKIKRMKKK